MRLFIAFEIQPEERASVLKNLDALALPPHLQKTDPAKWHITLVFLGEVDPALAERLRIGLQKYRHLEPRRIDPLELECLDAFPNLGRARVLWLGPSKVPGSLNRIRDEIIELLSREGFAIRDPEQEFRPHLTLSRLRSRQNLKRVIPVSLPEKVRIKMKRLHLMESTIKEGRTIYTSLATVDFESVQA